MKAEFSISRPDQFMKPGETKKKSNPYTLRDCNDIINLDAWWWFKQITSNFANKPQAFYDITPINPK